MVESGSVSREVKLAAIALAWFLAWLTVQFIEKPVKSGGRKSLIAVLLLFVMFVVFDIGIAINKGFSSPRNNNPALAPIVTAIGDWEYPKYLRQHVFQGEVFNYLKGNSGQITVMMGDSHIEQYGPRVVELSHVLPDKLNTVYFSTLAACPQIPFIEYPDGASCKKHIQSTLEFIKVNKVNTVVITACWNCYFHKHAYNLHNTPFSDNYSYVKNGKREGFSDGTGKHLALQELELFLKRLSGVTKVFLMLDNPISIQQDPVTFLEGARLGTFRAKKVSQSFVIPAEQFALRNKLIGIANRSGVEIIDPDTILCALDKQTCLRMTIDSKPIYKDSNHLRPFFVREYADYLDKALLAR